MKCPGCGATDLRTSRLRLSDLPRLLIFQYPIRCRACRERRYTGLLRALHLRRDARARRIEEQARKHDHVSHKPGV